VRLPDNGLGLNDGPPKSLGSLVDELAVKLYSVPEPDTLLTNDIRLPAAEAVTGEFPLPLNALTSADAIVDDVLDEP
jgi:hypothetical protein